jgi:hypothetical protein
MHELLEKARLEKLRDLFCDQLCEYHWALELYRQALEIKKKTPGEEHLAVADVYNSMRTVLQEQGMLAGRCHGVV